jgi:hypothetical protein
MVGGKAAAEARAVTAMPVRCSAWLGVDGFLIELKIRWNELHIVNPSVVAGNSMESFGLYAASSVHCVEVSTESHVKSLDILLEFEREDAASVWCFPRIEFVVTDADHGIDAEPLIAFALGYHSYTHGVFCRRIPRHYADRINRLLLNTPFFRTSG